MSGKRLSTIPIGPKPPTSLDPSLNISEQASLTGTKLITLGSNTVIHPRCKLNSTNASITIGNNCIISERCRIGLQSEPEAVDSYHVVIENGVVVETGAIVEALIVGEGSIIEVNSKIGRGAILGKVRYKRFFALNIVDNIVVLQSWAILRSSRWRGDPRSHRNLWYWETSTG